MLKDNHFDYSKLSPQSMDGLTNLAIKRIQKNSKKVTLLALANEIEKIAETVRLLPKGFGLDSDVHKSLLLYNINLTAK